MSTPKRAQCSFMSVDLAVLEVNTALCPSLSAAHTLSPVCTGFSPARRELVVTNPCPQFNNSLQREKSVNYRNTTGALRQRSLSPPAFKDKGSRVSAESVSNSHCPRAAPLPVQKSNI